MRIDRRSFLATAFALGTGTANAQTNILLQDAIAGTAAAPELLNRLQCAIRELPAFINHLHFGQEAETLKWYFPNRIVGRTNDGSSGLQQGLQGLLGLEDPITQQNAEEVRSAYLEFCEQHTPREYYHRVSDLTQTRTTAFIARQAMHAAGEFII